MPEAEPLTHTPSGLLDRLRAALPDRYQVGRELGRGGMGAVFLAHDLRYGRAVAVKVLHPELAPSLGAQRFLAEIRVAAGLTHPHVVTVFDSGEADGLLYYLMPYVEGESLRERLKREGPLPVEEALRLAREVADALAFAHARGVVHRDVKPENILLAHGHASVADFGVARAVSTAADERLTATGLILGSPPYLSPEQADPSLEVDGRADLYSLGCVLHEMLTGEPPFGSRGAQATLFRHLTEPPPRLRSLRPDVPSAVEAAVLRALAKDPAERFATADEMVAALDGRMEAARALPAPRPPRVRRRPDRRLLAGAALVLLALLAVSLLSLFPSSAPSLPGVAVLPFEVAGEGGPGTAQATPPDRWLARSLALLPVVQVVEAQAVLDGAGNWRALPLRDVAQRARRRGARYLVLGSVLGDRLTVELYAAREGREIFSGGALEGETPVQALDRLALEIVRSIAEAEDLDLGTLAEVASATTSLAALTELLRGQELFFRGETEAAVEAYRRAIEADSAFGPAYLRLSVAETWSPRWDYAAALRAAEAGLARRDRMSPRWVDLLSAQRHVALRNADSALVQFQRVVSENPRLPDALLGLGEVLLHSGGFLGEPASVARPVLERLVAADSAFAPIYHHLAELALYAGDERAARAHLRLIRDPQRARELAVALHFGGGRERAAVFDSLRAAEIRTIATVAAIFAQDSLNLPLADSVARLLTLPDRNPQERQLGARTRLAALAGQGRWAEALAAWDSAAGNPPFDPWLVHAFLAGFPVRERVAPMFRWAEARVAAEPPNFAPLRGDAGRREAQDAFRALVHRATVHGDSAEAQRLLSLIHAAAPTAEPSDPEPAALDASLRSRLALLAGDTTLAILHLERAVARVPWSTNWFWPLTDAAPQRLLLAQLQAARGDRAGAERRLASFGQVWAFGDAVFYPAVATVQRTLATRPPGRMPQPPR